MSFTVDPELLQLVEDVLSRMILGAKSEIQTPRYKVKAYNVNSSQKYASPSIRIDIQSLELRDYS